jgi:type I restriction enzyme S subunit
MASERSTLSTQLLKQHFDTLAETPEAVPKLRKFILGLAVRGELLAQNSEDEKNARWSEFTAKFAHDAEDLPFLLPKSWRWVRLNDVADYAAADKVDPSKINDSDWVLDLEEIEKDTSRIVRIAHFAEKQSSSTKSSFLPGDVLYGKLRPYLNKVVVAPQAGFCTTEIVPIRSRGIIEPGYLCVFLRSPDFVGYASSKSYGMKMPRLGTNDAISASIAVPPPAEQRRIVAKVDELLALCDELEARQTAAREHRSRLVRSALDHLTTAQDEKDFKRHSSFCIQNSELLSDAVPAFRKAVLSLAVEGRLLPSGAKKWEDQPLSKVAENIVDCPHSTPKWTETGRICVRTNQFKPGALDLANPRFVSENTFRERIQRLKPKEDDILYSREGGILGIACRVPPKTELCLGQRMMLIRSGPLMDPAFLELVLNSPQITRIARDGTTGGAAPHVNVSTVRQYPIPVPPFAEQKRIVAKVDELMRWCDELEARLNTAQTTATALLDATLSKILEDSGRPTAEGRSDFI